MNEAMLINRYLSWYRQKIEKKDDFRIRFYTRHETIWLRPWTKVWDVTKVQFWRFPEMNALIQAVIGGYFVQQDVVQFFDGLSSF